MPKWNNCFEEFICYFDTYATSFQVQFRYKSFFQTHYGGFISTILIALGIAALIVLYIFFESRDEQKIVTFRQRYYEPPELHLSSNYTNVTYSVNETNHGFFFYAIYFLNMNTSQAMTLDEVKKKMKFISQDIVMSNGKKNGTDLIFTKCGEIYPDIANRFNNSRLNDSYCSKNITLNVKGEFISDIYHYILLRLTKYSNEDLTDYLSTIKVMLYRSDYTINTKIKTDSPITYIMKTVDIPLENKTNFEDNIYVSYNVFRSNDDIYAPWWPQKIQTCFKIDKIITQYLPQDHQYRLMSVYLRSSYQYDYYQRNFKSFFSLLAQIGGVSKVLLFIGSLLVVPINRSLMNVAISNKMFNMVHPDNEPDVQMTYDQYLAKEEQYDQIPDIFRSLNPLLKQMSIEYYRYERNKGLDFTLKEALGKVLCCCFRLKSLESKDMILKSSRREIEIRLDTVAIAKFAQESKAIKKVLLGNYSSLINYKMSTNISFHALNRIRQESNEHNAFSKANPISIVYHKQNHLVSAFNILRNQGDLTKTDLLLIKLFTIDPELVMKFFLIYCDRFELIYPHLFNKGNQYKDYRDEDYQTDYAKSVNTDKKVMMKRGVTFLTY